MKAWIVREFGGLDKMKWEDLPDPASAAGEILIDVVTSGINFAESRMRDGSYKGTPLPHILGLECAGTVAKVGVGVTKFKPGDRVMARTRGSHATKVLADARKSHPLPPAMSFEEGAAVPVGWHTAWHALVTVANAQPGQRVLIEAVASSVGSAALQIAKHRGCWVGGTASRDDKLAVAKSWGCDAVYNYKAPDWSTKVLADTQGAGIDISCATIGAETIQALLDAMGQEGKVINYGSTSGIVITYNLRIGERNISLHSMSIDTSPKYVPITLPTFEAQAMPMFASGGYKAVVDTVLPMSDLPRAHEMIHERRHFGKIIMKNG
jgi:NADPH2:quinone reductase